MSRDIASALTEFVEGVVEDLDMKCDLEDEIERLVESEACRYFDDHLAHEIETALPECTYIDEAIELLRQEFHAAIKQADVPAVGSMIRWLTSQLVCQRRPLWMLN